MASAKTTTTLARIKKADLSTERTHHPRSRINADKEQPHDARRGQSRTEKRSEALSTANELNPEANICANLAQVKACLRWQALLVCIWSQMYIFLVFVERPRNRMLIIATWIIAALTLWCGRWVTRSGSRRLPILSSTFALLCTMLCCAVLGVASIPSLEKEGSQITPHSFLGTVLSGALACVSVRATTCIQRYCDAHEPLRSSHSAKHASRRPQCSMLTRNGTANGSHHRKAAKRMTKA